VRPAADGLDRGCVGRGRVRVNFPPGRDVDSENRVSLIMHHRIHLGLFVALVLSVAPARAVDLEFADGTSWTGVRIVSGEPTSLIVLRSGAVETVHAAQLSEACRAALNLRLPTEAERTALAAAGQRARDEAEKREQQRLALAERARLAATSAAVTAVDRVPGTGEAARETPAAPVREPSSIVPIDPWGAVTEIWLDGRIVARAEGGALVRADGPPSQGRRSSDHGWLEGLVFIQPDRRLIATTRDTPVFARVVPAGERHITGGDGAVRIVAAYRLY